MIEHLEGDTFEQVKEHISRDNQLQIFEAMGEELGKLHSYQTFGTCSWAMEQAPYYYREVIKLVEQMMENNSPG